MLPIITRVIKCLSTLLTCEILHSKKTTDLCMLVLQAVCSCEMLLKHTMNLTSPVNYNLSLFITSCTSCLFTFPCFEQARYEPFTCLCLSLQHNFLKYFATQTTCALDKQEKKLSVVDISMCLLLEICLFPHNIDY